MAPPSAPTFTTPKALAFILTLAVCALPSLFAHRIAPGFDALYDQIDHRSAYFPNASPLLVYVATPLVTFGALALVMLPGLLATLVLGTARTLEEWFLKGFAISLVSLSAVTQLVQALVEQPVTGFGFIATAIALAAVFALALWRRVHSGARLPVPAVRLTGILGLVLVPLLFLVALTPKFFLEAFNGDGAHAYEASRLLLVQAAPFWPTDSGEGGMYPGVNTFLFTYPTAWFIRLFGEYEAAARLPLLLYLLLLYAAITAVATAARPPLRCADRSLAWASVVSFALVMSYSATYDPYCADIALPATQDTLLMVCFLGAVFAFLRRQHLWSCLFIGLGLTGSPAGLPLAGAWLVAVLLAERPIPWRRAFLWGLALVVAMAFASVIPSVLAGLGQNPPGEEHTSGQLLRKFRFLIPFDFARLALVVVPCGIYAVFGLLAWRRMDGITRALWLVAGVLFAMYYPLAFVSLHYFVPAMVLPVVAFWRHQRSGEWSHRRSKLAACWIAAAAAIWLGLPQGPSIHVASREIGERIEVRGLPDYATMQEGYLRAPGLLVELFPKDWDPDVPERRYGGSPLAWNYYAHRADSPRAINYRLLGKDLPAPLDAALIASSDDAALYVCDERLLEQHRHIQPLTSNGRALYAFARDILFRRATAGEFYFMIDLREWKRWLLGED